MKKIKFLTSSALLVPIAITPIVTSCSCSGDNEGKDLVKKLNNVFNKTPNAFVTTPMSDSEAKSAYATNIINTEDARKNEILFACFNFACKQGLTINGTSCTPDNKSFLDLFNDGKAQINAAYNINVKNIENNKFAFQIQGWMNGVYTKDVDNFKAGDYIQFSFDIEADAYANIAIDESEAGKYIMYMKYTFDNNALGNVYGFIKYKTNGTYHQTLGITDMQDVNYDNNNKLGYNRGFYNKK